jgi:UDP-glucose 4-epimerase
MYETLVTAEEMLKAKDLGAYFRVQADNRDLNYKKYFSEGQTSTVSAEYNSENTRRLGVKEMKELLLELPEIKKEMNDQ